MSKSPDPSASYGSSSKRYLKLGWWPIPVAGKAHPEPGTTGKTLLAEAPPEIPRTETESPERITP